MPVLDMPLEKLKTYQGTNPRPADFDAFWDARLKALAAVDPDVKLEPADFTVPFADCFDMYYTGIGGARIHAKLLQPKKSGRKAAAPHPAVLQFHGYSGDAGDWADKLGLVALGFTVAAMDCRGQGGKSQDLGGVVGNTLHGHIIRGIDGPPEQMLFVQNFLDTAQLARIVAGMPDVDPQRMAASGGSQGGGLTLACAGLVPGIKLAAPTFPFLCDYRRVWNMDLVKTAYKELREYFRLFDPLHEREEEIFTKLGYIDAQFLAPRIRAEVYLAVGLVDETCPPSSQFAAFNKITSKKTVAVYPDFGHEGLRGHVDRVFKFLQQL